MMGADGDPGSGKRVAMFPLGHLGLGQQLIPARLRKRLSLPLLWLGCLLPDLIDKPLWLAQITRHLPLSLSFLRGTRMLGHTLLLVAALALAAGLLRSWGLAAVALGALTHAALDLAGDLATAPRADWKIWLLWPLFGIRFEAAGDEAVLQHWLSEKYLYLAGELLGAGLLIGQLLSFELYGAKICGLVMKENPEMRMQTWKERVAARKLTVGIIGQGYVGLPLGLVFCEAGFAVVGFDLDTEKVKAIARGESYIRHIGPERVSAAVQSGRYQATATFDRLPECDAVLICVPTPLGRHREPDNSYIHSTAKEIARRLRPGQLVVLESTTYPGTTNEEVLPILESSGLACPRDFLLAFSPEREDPGRKNFTTKTIPKVVGGVNRESTEAAAALYAAGLAQVVEVSSARVAESSKLLENVFRSVNIALVNELKMLFDRMGIDIWEVIRAAETKPFGFMPFYPGPGLGGHCIPLDPFYLSWKAAEHGEWARFIELAGEINTRMPRYVIDKVMHALNGDGKALKGSRVLVLGLAYKANIDDDRESPAYEILEMLQESGASIDYCDPFFAETHKTRKHDLGLKSVPCEPGSFARYDAIVIATAHDAFKDAKLFLETRLVIDTRNLVAPLFRNGGGPRIVQA